MERKEREKKRGRRRGYLRVFNAMKKEKQDESRDSDWAHGWVSGRGQHVWSRKALKIFRSMSNLPVFFASQVIISENRLM